MLLLLGTIIGAGIFGVPAMIGAWGVLPSLLAFSILTIVVLAMHLLYAEALIVNRNNARLVGQANYFLGKGPAALGGLLQTLQIFGSNLAYVILGGEFLAVLFRLVGLDVPTLFWQMVFWLIGGSFVLYGLPFVSRIETYLTWSLVAVILFLMAALSGNLDFRIVFQTPYAWSFEPYGVFLFALLGVTALPEVADVVNRNREDLRKAIVRGTVLAAILTYGFGAFVWLASSGTLSRDPADIVLLLPTALAFIVPLFGLLAVMTSYISSALDLRNMFHADYHFSDMLALLVALGTPLVLLFLTSRDFLATIGLVGSIFGAAIAVLVSWMGRAALRKRREVEKFSTMWLWREIAPILITAFFAIGGMAWVISG